MWDPAKNALNITKHGIDFTDAVRVFAATKLYTYRSDRKGEVRYTAIGPIDDIMVSVAYTDRQDGDTMVRRLISVRRARKHEKQAYTDA
jgi:uncharacterized DUF497 family protein